MAGLVPAIHVEVQGRNRGKLAGRQCQPFWQTVVYVADTWMAGSSPGHDGTG